MPCLVKVAAQLESRDIAVLHTLRLRSSCITHTVHRCRSTDVGACNCMLRLLSCLLPHRTTRTTSGSCMPPSSTSCSWDT